MTSDNRTNEPNQNETKSGQAFCFTEAQVEAAAKAIYGDDPAWGYVNDYGGGEVASQWRHLGEGIQEMFRLKARAALVAAQGAAPQAAKDIHEPSHDRVYCVRCGGNWPCQPAPVLPSSTVDEDKLAEVIESIIRENWEMFDDRRHQAQVIARAVAEWLKEQGRGSEM